MFGSTMPLVIKWFTLVPRVVCSLQGEEGGGGGQGQPLHHSASLPK